MATPGARLSVDAKGLGETSGNSWTATTSVNSASSLTSSVLLAFFVGYCSAVTKDGWRWISQYFMESLLPFSSPDVVEMIGNEEARPVV